MTNGFLVRSLAVDNTVESKLLDLCALGASDDLPYAPNRYFAPDSDSFLVELGSLVTIRCRPEGVANGARRMRAAYEGKYPPRPPVTVSPVANGDFLVVDGNSTVLNAIASGWPDIWCRRSGES